MTSVEKTGRTADEAIEAALAELGATREQVEVEILQEPTRSFLGILGHSEAKVRVSLQRPEGLGETARQYLAEMVSHMDVPATVELVSEDDEEVSLDIEGADLGILIGKHGQTLGALQLLVAIMTNRGREDSKRIIVDAQGYRARREQSLRGMAENAARKAAQTGRDVILEDLAPNERRIIHTTLADDPTVTTRSIGEDPYRKVVVSAAGGPAPRRRREPAPPEQPAAPEQPQEPEAPEAQPPAGE